MDDPKKFAEQQQGGAERQPANADHRHSSEFLGDHHPHEEWIRENVDGRRFLLPRLFWACIVVLGVAGVVSLYTKNAYPILAAWSVVGPILALLIDRYFRKP